MNELQERIDIAAMLSTEITPEEYALLTGRLSDLALGDANEEDMMDLIYSMHSKGGLARHFSARLSEAVDLEMSVEYFNYYLAAKKVEVCDE